MFHRVQGSLQYWKVWLGRIFCQEDLVRVWNFLMYHRRNSMICFCNNLNAFQESLLDVLLFYNFIKLKKGENTQSFFIFPERSSLILVLHLVKTNLYFIILLKQMKILCIDLITLKRKKVMVFFHL